MSRINWMEFRETVPSKMASAIAPRVNAMIAPAVPYGITGSMEAYPGAFQIPEAAYGRT